MTNPKAPDNDGVDDLEETKRIMERLVRTPPKPHKDKGEEKPTGKKGESPEKPARKRREKKSGQ